MQTYSHFIMTALLNRTLRARQTAAGRLAWLPPLRSGPLLWGSVAPDLPLITLTLVMIGLDWWAGMSWQPGRDGDPSYVGRLFDVWFFHNPWVMAAHNLFHAPLMALAYAGAGYWAWRQGRAWGPGLFWFAAACALHTAIDIPVHYDDGPLLLFPFEWTVRFYSPLSYWDPRRYGAEFTIFEHLLVLGMLVGMAVEWWRRRQARPQTVEEPAGMD
jgi:hypothetical protein